MSEFIPIQWIFENLFRLTPEEIETINRLNEEEESS